MDKLKRALSFALATLTALTMSACDNRLEKNNDEIKKGNEKPFENQEKLFESENSSKNYDELIEYTKKLQEMEIPYVFQEYYPTLEQIQSLIKKADVETECNVNIPLDLDKLFERIKDNSYSAFIRTPNSGSLFVIEGSYPKMLSEGVAVEETVQIAFEKCLKKALEMLKDATNDTKDDLHQIAGLRFLVITGGEIVTLHNLNGVYDQRNHIGFLYKEAIEEAQQKGELEEYLFTVISRCLNDVRMLPCACRNEQAQNKGGEVAPFKVEETSYHSVLETTLVCATVESYMQNQTTNGAEMYDYIYQSDRKDQAYLMYMAMFDKEHTVEEYYNAMFDNSVKDVHAFFGLETDADLLTFYQMLYSCDSLSVKSSLPDKLSKDGVSLTLREYYDAVGLTHHINLYRILLSRLANYTLENDLDITSNMMLFHLFKDMVTDRYDWVYDSDSEENEAFTLYSRSVQELTELYEEFLSKCYGMPIDQIKDLENGEELKDYIRALVSLVDGKIEFNRLHGIKARELLRRFPLLRDILSVTKSYCYLGYCDSTSFEEALVRQRQIQE